MQLYIYTRTYIERERRHSENYTSTIRGIEKVKIRFYFHGYITFSHTLCI